ncbi:Cholinesterase [Drechslerella dactyloides]|uniref:Carboxylic ester hydrolase n=1 Tax=Drechslerella dactyloides TaxID=74499 RepID=A0AAD6J3Q2_DREDA|nr:Cholinesterase [Drechslerella dactyloides]
MKESSPGEYSETYNSLDRLSRTMRPLLLTILPFLSILTPISAHPSPSVPKVTIRNGTVRGFHSNVWNQDFFLGIPYAQPPTGKNRFNLPQPIEKKWNREFVATAFGDRCLGIGHSFDLPESEDCLNINVIRPVGCEYHDLPVLVWIHGGGFLASGSSNPPYNMTFQVDQSVKINKPIIAVSFNYRLSAWGMLGSTAMSAAGIDNIGLKDQRMALHWVQENIAAFGGDPKKVTIAGDSAGGASVGIHTLAYGGRDDGLFRAAIMNSGNALYMGKYADMPLLDFLYGQLVDAAGCTGAADTLTCLRELPTATIWPAIQAVTDKFPQQWQYHIDGSFIKERGSISLKRGRFVKVPLLLGSTTDEGTYLTAYGVNTTEELVYAFKMQTNLNLPDDVIATILKDYPDNPVVGSPGGTIERFAPPYGLQYKRLSSIAGDMFNIAGRRLSARAWAERGQDAYSWRFNTIPNGFPREMGATHVSDQAFVFANFLGVGYPGRNYYDVEPPERKARYIQTGLLMSRAIMSFVHDLTPNNHGMPGYPVWPKYEKDDPKNFVFDGNTTSYVEPDTFRTGGMNIFIHQAQEFLH